MPPDGNRSSGNSRMRWWALALAAIAVPSSYYNDDAIGPIADLLHRQRGFSQSQLGMAGSNLAAGWLAEGGCRRLKPGGI